MEVESEDIDFCNICRSNDEGVLVRPCLCKGSIGGVHQECLSQWLKVASNGIGGKAEKCSLCGFQYEWLKIYSTPNLADATLSPLLLLRRIILSLTNGILTTLRGILVIGTWLALLPYIVSTVFKSFLWSANNLGNLLNTHQDYSKLENSTIAPLVTLSNITVAAVEGVVAETVTGEEGSYWSPIFTIISADILTGQIITSTVIVIFVIGFLFREWILQNAAQPNVEPPEAAMNAMAIAQNLLVARGAGTGGGITMDEIREMSGLVGRLNGADAVLEEQDDEEDDEHEEKEVEEDEEDEEDFMDRSNRMEASSSKAANIDSSVNPPQFGYIPSPGASQSNSVNTSLFNDQPFAFNFEVSPKGKAKELDQVYEDVDDSSEEEYERRSKGKARQFNELAEDYSSQNSPPSARTQRALNRNRRSLTRRKESFSSGRAIKKLPTKIATRPRRPPLNAYEAGQVFNINIPRPPVVVPVLDGNGLEDGNFEEGGGDLFEIDGILEAVGMKGSLLTLIQNASLMILLLSLCLAATILLPLIIGRVLAATNAVRLLVLPVRAIRTVSDPIFDFGFTFLIAALRVPLSPITKLLPTFIPKSSTASSLSPSLFSKLASITPNIPPQLLAFTSLVQKLPSIPSTLISSIRTLWRDMASIDTFPMRLANISLGYGVVLSIGLAYLSATAGDGEVNQVFRTVLDQQLILIKVISFVIIEIVAFPSVCGLIINLATIPLFPDTSIQSRIKYFTSFPFSAFFLTWLGGTSFMVSFSLAIDSIRSAMRTGVLWFIRNPSSEFHPLREIMNRKATAQAKKIVTSIFLYGGVILSIFGTSTLFLKFFIIQILPLKWSYQSYSYVSFDLIVMLTIIPLTLNHLDLRAYFHRLFIKNVNFTARSLRLSSLLFGKRERLEEFTTHRSTWRAFFRMAREGAEVSITKDGSFARVPSSDNIRIRPGRKMFIASDEYGDPLSEEGKTWVSEQILEMVTFRKQDAYQVIYLPPRWTWRVGCFIFLNWLSAMSVVLSAFVTILLTGRFTFSLLISMTDSKVHDVHSLILGGYILLAGVYLGRFILSGLKTTPAQILLVIQSVFLLITLPTLLSLNLSLYVLLPFKTDLTTIPTFSVALNFGQGLLISSIIYQLTKLKMFSDSKLKKLFERVKIVWEAGLKRKALQMLVKTLIVTVLPLLLFMILFPAGLVYAVYLGSEERGQARFQYLARIGYAIASVAFGLLAARGSIEKSVELWLLSVRESEFLVERKLKNYQAPVVEELD